ncbi:MAG: DUF167 domain-containing protein [Candidatus Manganitrophaceae bacterium]|nr:MAG: DUF167 domain-containing protein [Candidatus Manganitrophaceae bacterium]
MESPFRPYKSGALLHLRVTPNASRDSVESCLEGMLRLKLRAIPAEGAANAACIRFLSKLFDLPKSRLEMVRGEKSREKWVWFKEVDPSVLIQQLSKILSE